MQFGRPGISDHLSLTSALFATLTRPMMQKESKPFLDEQNHVSLKMVSAFSGGRVAAVEQDVCSIEDPIKALEAAKKRAHKSQSDCQKITSRSSLVIAEGSGRHTSEFELQWWPKLYSSNFGKLTRYVAKWKGKFWKGVLQLGSGGGWDVLFLMLTVSGWGVRLQPCMNKALTRKLKRKNFHMCWDRENN